MPKPKFYTAFGETKKWGPWIKDDRCVVGSECVRSRLKYGWDFERALTEPYQDRRKMMEAFGETKPLLEWVDDPRNVSGASYTTLQGRLNGCKMTMEEALEFAGREFPLYEAFGESKRWGGWMRDPRCIIDGRTIRSRLTYDWDFERAISEPYQGPATYEAFGEEKTLAGWTEDPRCEVSYQLLCQRLCRDWPVEASLTEPPQGQDLIEAFGEIKTFREWRVDPRCVSPSTLRDRLSKYSPEDAIAKYLGPTRYEFEGDFKTAGEWAEDSRCEVSVSVVYSRLAEGWSIEDTLKIKLSCRSQPEEEVEEFLSGLGYETIPNTREIIGPQEIDIFLPEINAGVEFNGLYWHSDLFKDKMYHQNKFRAAFDVGVDLLFVWEDDWIANRERSLRGLEAALTASLPPGKLAVGDWRLPKGSKVEYTEPDIKYGNDRFIMWDAGECIVA